MNRNSKTPIIVAVVLVAAVVVGTIAMRGRADPAQPAAPQSDVTVDAAGTTSAPAGRSTRIPAARSASTEAQLAEHVGRRMQRREEHIARTAAMKQQSAERFAAEQVDPAWAPQKEAELGGFASLAAFETAGVKPTDMRMDCKSSMCRIDGQFASSSEAEDWILIYMSSVGSAMPSSVVSRTQNPDGSTRVEIYGRAR